MGRAMQSQSFNRLTLSTLSSLQKFTPLRKWHKNGSKRFTKSKQGEKKQKVDEDEETSSGNVVELDITRKVSLSHCTAAIENIAVEVAFSNSLQEKFFQQQSERHDFKHNRHASIAAIGQQEVLRRSKLAVKPEINLLVLQKDHGPINDEKFRSQNNRLLSK